MTIHRTKALRRHVGGGMLWASPGLSGCVGGVAMRSDRVVGACRADGVEVGQGLGEYGMGGRGMGMGGMKQPREMRLDAGATIDLRRRMVRERVHGLLEGSRLLSPQDQWLLGQHLGSGRSMASIARELGCSADLVRARVRRLIVRVESEVYGFVLERAEAQMSGWDAEVRAIARACIGRGMSMRGAARELGVGVHVVRARMLEVHAMLAAARKEARGEARKHGGVGAGVGAGVGVRAGEAA